MNRKFYIILGGSSDVGRQFMRSLASDPGEYLIVAQYNTSGDLIDRECNDLHNVELVKIQCDLSEPQEVEIFIQHIVEEYGCPDGVILLAASKLKLEKFKSVSWHTIQKDMEIQLHAGINILQFVLPLMAKRKYGRIIFMISSCTLGAPPKFMTSYTVTKYAVLGLMKSLAIEYAGKGITINAISPNMMQTRFLDELDERTVEMIADNSVMKRHIRIDETVHMFKFLLSDSAECINGVNMNLTGGERM